MSVRVRSAVFIRRFSGVYRQPSLRQYAGSFFLFLVIGIVALWTLPVQASQGNLAAYWKFDESTAGTTAADGSGNGNDLTPVGSPTPSTSIPSGMNSGITDTHSVGFNGSSQYFSVADNSLLDNTGAVTLSTWVKFNSVSGNQTIMAKWQVGVRQQWVLQSMGNKITWWTGDGGSGAADELVSSSTITSGTWYHIVATATNGTKNLYINGTLDNSDTAGSMGLASGTPVTVGSKQDSGASYFEYLNGSVDDMRIYSRVLSASEASSLASGSESTVLTGGSAVANEIGTTSTISDLQVSSTAANSSTVYVKMYVNYGTISLGTTTGLTFYSTQGTSLGGSQPSNATILHIGGTLQDINTDLATLRYTRTTAGTGTDTLAASLVAPGQVFFSGNNHLYQYVAGPVTWPTAKAAADASTMDGATGYLATITSQAENDFIQTQLKSDSWIGASDDSSQGTSEGNWIWADGPEHGQQFWSGNGSGSIVNGMYVHWNNSTTGGTGQEPNNSGNNENCAEFYYSNNGLWNDLNCSSTLGYIIEYGSPGNMPTVSSKNIAITTADTTPPTKPGTPTAASPTTNLKPTVSWTASTDSGSGLASPAYTLQWSTSATFATVTGSATTNSTSLAPPSNLSDGTWYFRVAAADASGNSVNSNISSYVVIDTTSPTIPGTPSTTSPTSNAKPVWTWTASTDSGSGLASPAYSVQWSKDSAFGSGVSSGTASSASFTVPSNLSDGTWYFRVRAADTVGNNSAYSANGSVLVDTTAPTVPGTPTSSSDPNDNTPTFSWTASTDSGSGLAALSYTVEWSQDTLFSGLGGIDTATGNTYTVPSGLNMSDSTWYFRVMATDAAGNNSAWSGYATVNIDTTAPVISSQIAIDGTSAGQEIVTWTTDGDASSQVSYGPTASYGATTVETDTSPRVTSHSVTLTGLKLCTLYHYHVASTDASGNTGSGSDGTFITAGCAGSAPVSSHNDAQISPTSGGTVALGGNVSIGVPAGFAGSSADFQIKQIDATDSLKIIGVPGGMILAGGNVYDIKAVQDATTTIDTFDHGISVTMHYTDPEIANLVKTSLKIYRWDSGIGWQALGDCVVDTNATTVTCTTTGFSTFALFGVTKPAGTTAKSSGQVSQNTPASDTNPETADTSAPSSDIVSDGSSSDRRDFADTSQSATKNIEDPEDGSNLFVRGVALLFIVGIAVLAFWFIVARKRRKKDDSN